MILRECGGCSAPEKSLGSKTILLSYCALFLSHLLFPLEQMSLHKKGAALLDLR